MKEERKREEEERSAGCRFEGGQLHCDMTGEKEERKGRTGKSAEAE